MTAENSPVTRPLAVQAHRLLAERGWTLAVAESLTGGLLAATLVDVPGASLTFRGGLIVYATDLKTKLAGVPAELLTETGPVDSGVAESLAAGARRECGADWGLATTGVAGPGPADGFDAGTVWLGLAEPSSDTCPAGARSSERLTLSGDRPAIRAGAVEGALRMLVAALRER